MVKQRFVKQITDCRAYSQFRKIKITQYVPESARQTYEVRPEAIKEYLTGEEAQRQRQEIENQIDAGIQECLSYS